MPILLGALLTVVTSRLVIPHCCCARKTRNSFSQLNAIQTILSLNNRASLTQYSIVAVYHHSKPPPKLYLSIFTANSCPERPCIRCRHFDDTFLVKSESVTSPRLISTFLRCSNIDSGAAVVWLNYLGYDITYSYQCWCE
jgi:hypothetical protein